MIKPLAFTIEDAQKAADAWRFNCGPAALCAVLDMTPEAIRPHLGDFQQKGYINPTQLLATLHSLQIKWKMLYKCQNETRSSWLNLPKFGLLRIQFGGPWTAPEVPIVARYGHTHWVAVRNNPARSPQREVFDINALCSGGWIGYDEWRCDMMPWLIREGTPRADGTFYPTHSLEIIR